MKKVNYSPEIIDEAKRLYLEEIPIREIAKRLGINRFTTISRWVNQFRWIRSNSPATEQALDRQIEITNELLGRFEPIIKGISFVEMEPQIVLPLYLRVLDHQIKLIKLKTVNQSTENVQSIFEFSENSA